MIGKARGSEINSVAVFAKFVAACEPSVVSLGHTLLNAVSNAGCTITYNRSNNACWIGWWKYAIT